jgi:predicted outer membrane repeat protein
LAISKDLTIRGPKTDQITISGDHRSGVLDITADPGVQAVTLANLTIADGTGITVNGQRVGGGLFNDHATVTLSNVDITGNVLAAGGAGGGVYNATGSAILNSSTVTGNSVASNGEGGGIATASGSLILNSSNVSGNSIGNGQFGFGGGISATAGLVVLNSSVIAANQVGTNGDGGGLSLGGPANITDTTIAGNSAGFEGGGLFVQMPLETTNQAIIAGSAILGNHAMAGGGLANASGNVTIDRTAVSGNSVPGGRNPSGLGNTFGQMTITDSLISDNSGGSGIQNFDQMAISGSTIAGNSTPFEGGGLRVDYGDTNVVNCTFSGNTAGTAGGGISVSGSMDSVASLELTSVTITANAALGTGTIHGGGGLQAPTTLQGTPLALLRNTLIAGNSTASIGPDVIGVVVSLGYNLAGEGDDSRGWAPTDHVGSSFAPLDPMLGPLHDNGGPTPTHALLAGSPAINGGDPRLLGTLDQRGTVRFHAGTNPPVDVGAFDAGARHGFELLAPAEVVAGEPFGVTVIALDANGHTASSFPGSIHFSSTDPNAILPDDYTFTPSDGGVASFSITLQTEGSQQLVVNDVDIPTIRTSATVTVDPSTAPQAPLASFGDLFVAEANPMDGWLAIPLRKSSQSTWR